MTQHKVGEPPAIGPGSDPGTNPVQCCTFPGCAAALVNGKCPHGHAQTPKGDDGPKIIHVGPTDLDWSPVPYNDVRMIQSGLIIPNQQCSRRLCRMIRVLMGEANPDLI